MSTKEAIVNIADGAIGFAIALELMGITIDNLSTTSVEELERRKELLREKLQCASAHVLCGFEQLIQSH